MELELFPRGEHCHHVRLRRRRQLDQRSSTEDIYGTNLIPLDTHANVTDFTGAGFTEEQAEALTRALKRTQEIDLRHL